MFNRTSLTSKQTAPSQNQHKSSLKSHLSQKHKAGVKKPGTQRSCSDVEGQQLAFPLHYLLLLTKKVSLYSVNGGIYTYRNTHWSCFLHGVYSEG